MPYRLLYSRNRSDDSIARFEDIPIEEPSLMIDVLSFSSRIRRSAGWLYPVIAATPLDFERGPGTRILFGKTRIKYPDYTGKPFFLEFFPEYGVSSYIISVYGGHPGPEGPTFASYPDGIRRIYLEQSSGKTFVSQSATADFSYLPTAPLSSEVFLLPNLALYLRGLDGVFYVLGDGYENTYTIPESLYDQDTRQQGAILIPPN